MSLLKQNKVYLMEKYDKDNVYIKSHKYNVYIKQKKSENSFCCHKFELKYS